ncbi:hypothetical protein E1A91_A13G137800v1 [Gossypium mustelinum]|uniref:Uncharacterized protein n=1 Tax=Gossypium mustelinum TaxID=34275 RepID=A0A5D2WHL5_GOSMU|nr:hypothetical protein E1A91_A13G137800v1 [Gossypium mustelinum]
MILMSTVYRHVVLPPEVAKLLPKNRLLSELIKRVRWHSGHGEEAYIFFQHIVIFSIHFFIFIS